MQEQILLLQYPNRVRNRPYNARQGAAPDSIRMKPTSGHLELDVNLNTAHNFNKFQGLKWGDAVSTAREVQNDTATYGLAAGFSGAKPRSAGRVQVKDRADREGWIYNQLTDIDGAARDGKVMRVQTLGGQIMRHEGPLLEEEERGKPVYFVGAFRGKELHLTKVDGTVQMRPQFHHLDAEEQRSRLAASRAAVMDGSAEQRPQGDPRSLLMKNKTAEEAERDQKQDRMKRAMQASEAEPWVQLEYVDEDQEEAYEKFRDRMFVRDLEAVPKLQSGMDNDQYLDAISMPRRESPTRRRKRPARRRGTDATEEGEEQAGEEATAGQNAGGAAAEEGVE